MQGLADGYFVLPNTIGDYLASNSSTVNADASEVRAAEADVKRRTPTPLGRQRTVSLFHRELGKIMWEYCGMARDAAGLRKALEHHPGAARGVLARGE